MPLSYTCPKCFKSHAGISESMRGKKVRCHCGTEVRLGPKPGADPNAQSRKGPVVVEPFSYENPASSPPPTEQPVYSTPSFETQPASEATPAFQPQPVFESPPVPQSPLPSDWAAGNPLGTPAAAGPAMGGRAYQSQPSPFGPKKFSQQSIIRLIVGMISGTLSIVFSILCFWLVAAYGETVSGFSGNFQGGWNGGPGEARGSTAVAILTVVIVIVAIATLVSGFLQFFGAWTQAMRQNSSHPWPDVLAVAVSIISIVAILATFVYANIQVSQVFSVTGRASEISERALSQMPAARASEIRKQADQQKKMVRDIVWEIRWTLIKQLLVHAVMPSFVLGLSMFRLFKE